MSGEKPTWGERIDTAAGQLFGNGVPPIGLEGAGVFVPETARNIPQDIEIPVMDTMAGRRRQQNQIPPEVINPSLLNPVFIDVQATEPSPSKGFPIISSLLGSPSWLADRVVRNPDTTAHVTRIEHAMVSGAQEVTLSEKELLVRKYGERAIGRAVVLGGGRVLKIIAESAAPSIAPVFVGAVPLLRWVPSGWTIARTGSKEQVPLDTILTVIDFLNLGINFVTAGALSWLILPPTFALNFIASLTERMHSNAVNEFLYPRFLSSLTRRSQTLADYTTKRSLAVKILSPEKRNPEIYTTLYQETQDLNPGNVTPNNDQLRVRANLYLRRIGYWREENRRLQGEIDRTWKHRRKNKRQKRYNENAIKEDRWRFDQLIVKPYERAWKLNMIVQQARQIVQNP